MQTIILRPYNAGRAVGWIIKRNFAVKTSGARKSSEFSLRETIFSPILWRACTICKSVERRKNKNTSKHCKRTALCAGVCARLRECVCRSVVPVCDAALVTISIIQNNVSLAVSIHLYLSLSLSLSFSLSLFCSLTSDIFTILFRALHGCISSPQWRNPLRVPVFLSRYLKNPIARIKKENSTFFRKTARKTDIPHSSLYVCAPGVLRLDLLIRCEIDDNESNPNVILKMFRKRALQNAILLIISDNKYL